MSVVPRRANERRAGGAQINAVPEARKSTPCRRRANQRRAGGAQINAVPEARK
jgi:hypothetical protein